MILGAEADGTSSSACSRTSWSADSSARKRGKLPWEKVRAMYERSTAADRESTPTRSRAPCDRSRRRAGHGGTARAKVESCCSSAPRPLARSRSARCSRRVEKARRTDADADARLVRGLLDAVVAPVTLETHGLGVDADDVRRPVSLRRVRRTPRSAVLRHRAAPGPAHPAVFRVVFARRWRAARSAVGHDALDWRRRLDD